MSKEVEKPTPVPSKSDNVIAGIIVLVIIIGVVIFVNSNGSEIETENRVGTATAETEQVDNEDTVPESHLAQDVDSELKSSYGVENYTELLTEEQGYPNLGFVSEIEDMNSSTIRVHVQTDLTKEESEALGRNILATTGLQLEELSTVVVRATDGLDVNIFRSEIPALR